MSSNKPSEQIIEKVRNYALERKNDIVLRNAQIEKQMMEYKNICNSLPPNNPEKNMWLLLAKNCFELKKSADKILQGIDGVISQLDKAKDALSMMDLKNILLSLRPDENSKRINKDFEKQFAAMSDLIGDSQESNNNLFDTKVDDNEFDAYMASLSGGAPQQQQQPQAVDYSMYLGSMNVQPAMGANPYSTPYSYQQPQSAAQAQPEFDY